MTPRRPIESGGANAVFRAARLWAVAAGALLLMGTAASADELSKLEERAFQEAAALAAPSIVRIQTVGGLDQVEGMLAATGPTSGVAVSADGYIVSSAFNFASRPSSILVELPDGRRFPAEMVATDRLRMITLLKIEAENLTPAQGAPKSEIRVGQWALALGRTFESPVPSVSIGIVSAVNRIWGRAIQTDAKVSPVNYGGPLVDVRGRVLGVLVPLSPNENNATAGVEWYDSGIGFAVPMEDVVNVLERLKAGEDLYPGLVGIEFSGGRLLDEEVKIEHVRVLSPAEKAGLKPGDVITEIEGRNIARSADARFALGNRYAGDEVTVVVRRGEDKITTRLTLAKELPPYESGFLGILPARDPADAEAAAGAGVRYVYADSPAAKAGLRPRDRIVEFQGEPVADAEALARMVSLVRPGETVSLRYDRDGADATVEVKLASLPEAIPEPLPTVEIPAPSKPERAPANGNDAKEPRTGRYTVKMETQSHDYWVYVPDGYNPAYAYGLMVWIHPGGDAMEAAVFNEWRALCDRRGIILLGPKAAESNWTPNEAEFVKDAVAELRAKYTIDERRVFLHSHLDGGAFAYHLAFKYRDVFRGVVPVGMPISERPPENRPNARLQFHLVCGKEDAAANRVEATATLLRQLKFPVSLRTVDGVGREYPPEGVLDEIARWADCLDRI